MVLGILHETDNEIDAMVETNAAMSQHKDVTAFSTTMLTEEELRSADHRFDRAVQ